MTPVGDKKKVLSFIMILHKPHVASSIFLRATIFQNPEGTFLLAQIKKKYLIKRLI
jgi:hypothetical protein